MGISALHVSNEAPFHKKDEAGHLVFETITNLTKNNRWNSSQLAAIIRDCSEELSPSDPWSELGLCISGPLAFCISQWLHDFAKHDSITDLIFFARDGYLPKYAFDLVKSNTTTHYFPINRTIIVRASFLDVSPALLIQLTAHLPITKLGLLKKYYFESESIVAELSNSTNLKDTIFSEEQLVDFIQFAKISSATLVEEVDKLKSLITKLLDSCNALSRNSKIGFFDVGWLGSVSALLTELWPELKTSKFYYFGTEEQFLLESAHVRALFFHHGIPRLNRNICFQSIELFETMLTAKDHSAVSLLEEGRQIKPVYPKNIAAQIESQRVSLTQMILSAEKFVTFASRDRFSKRWTIDSAMIQAIIVTLMDTESSYVNKALGSLQHQVQSGQSNWVKIAGDSSEIRFLYVIMRWAKGRPIKLGRGSRWGKRSDEVYFNNLKGLKKLIALPFYIRRKKIMNRT